MSVSKCACVCVCVCACDTQTKRAKARERERERLKEIKKERERERENGGRDMKELRARIFLTAHVIPHKYWQRYKPVVNKGVVPKSFEQSLVLKILCHLCLYTVLLDCVCARERERERERGNKERVREKDASLT